MKLFEIRRGHGVVAQGVVFDDGRCAMRWLSEHASTATYDTVNDIIAIHGHSDTTIAQVAVFDEECRSLRINAMQDDIEGVANDFFGADKSRNLAYMWNERKKLAAKFDDKPLKGGSDG